MDFDLYHAINARGPDFVDDLFKYLANDLTALVVALVALLFLFPWPRLGLVWSRRGLNFRRGAVFGTVAAAVALLANQPIAHAVDRTRPYLAHPHSAHLLISRSHDPSFPSDHATGAFALATGVWFYDRLAGAALLVLAAVLAFARVYVGTHYPGDVLGGAAIAVAICFVLRWRPVRRRIEGFADWCSRVWDRVFSSATNTLRRGGIEPRS